MRNKEKRNIWKYLPLVELYKRLLQENIIYPIKLDVNYKKFVRENKTPSNITIEINIIEDFSYLNNKVFIYYNNGKYYVMPNTRHKNHKSKYIEKIIPTILDEVKQKEKMMKDLYQKDIQIQNELEKLNEYLNIPITRNYFKYNYNAGKKYSLSFYSPEISKEPEPLYCISTISGQYTLEELKK